MVKNLFFAKQHPLYRKLNLFLDLDLAMMPPDMYQQYKSTVGLKVEGKGGSDMFTCKNFDFFVEYVNKALKNNLCWAPSFKTWLNTCQSYNFTNDLLSNFNNWQPLSRFGYIRRCPDGYGLFIWSPYLSSVFLWST